MKRTSLFRRTTLFQQGSIPAATHPLQGAPVLQIPADSVWNTEYDPDSERSESVGTTTSNSDGGANITDGVAVQPASLGAAQASAVFRTPTPKNKQPKRSRVDDSPLDAALVAALNNVSQVRTFNLILLK